LGYKPEAKHKEHKMSQVLSLSAETREGTGKGVARSLRREGKIPGIIYGGNGGEIAIATSFNDLNKEYLKGHFTSKVVELDVDGKTQRVLPRDVQVHPVTDFPLHVDFQRLEEGKKIEVGVPVIFKNAERSPGLKRGGVLNIVRRDIQLLCEPDKVPSRLVFDLQGLQIGQSLHVSNVSIPDGCEPTITDRDFTIATITGRGKAAKLDDEAAEAEAAESAEASDEQK
jgi:large subunit ribosomal protein L25